MRGFKTGGRSKGVPNKSTIKRVEKAVQEIEQAKASGRKLAKDVLQEFMVLFAGIATVHQPYPPNQIQNPLYDEDKFERYATLTVNTAREVAKYESPQYRAIMVAPAPETEVFRKKRFTLSIFEQPPPQQPALPKPDSDAA